jgi:hypothetical protein
VHEIHREIPERAWLRMAFVALVSSTAALLAWETHVRSQGYEADYDDTPGLWVPLRQRAVGARREQLVLVGASRTLFDLDLDVLHEAYGGPRPIQLATVGSNPMWIFSDLADDPTFAGTLLVGVVPGLFSIPMDVPIPPNNSPKRFIERYEQWGPAQTWEQPLSRWMQEHFAFIQQEDLTLKELSRRLVIADRPGAHVPPKLPPHFSQLDLERRTRMRVSAERDAALMRRIQQIWLPLFTPPPHPPIFTDAQWAKMMADAWDATLAKAKANVEKIRARGGRVIFVNDPSSGPVLEIERRLTPRAVFWDRILKQTGAPGIHFEDYPELRDFTCPEWSHLSASDSVRYTRQLVAVMKREGLL